MIFAISREFDAQSNFGKEGLFSKKLWMSLLRDHDSKFYDNKFAKSAKSREKFLPVLNHYIHILNCLN